VLLLPILALAACAPDLGPLPQTKSASDYASSQSFAAPETSWPQSEWWKAYGDAQLDGLITQALADSPDIRVADARLREALAAAQISDADLWPTLTANGSLLPTRQSLNNGFPAAFKSFLPHGWHTESQDTVNLSYDLDLFGKDRATFAAATSEADAARVDAQAARLMISTAVAAGYADLVQLGADQKSAKDALRVRQDSANLVSQRVSQGLDNQGELAQAQARVAQARSDLDVLQGEIAIARNQLAALLGKGPDRGLDIAIPENVALQPFGLPASLAADLMGRRPDVTAARLRAEAAASRIDAAHADYYPNIDLTAYYGLESLGINTLVNHGSIIGQVGPAVHLPIFDAGRIEGNYRNARAQYDEAVATYDKSLTNALHEVADALANQRELRDQLLHAHQAQAASEKAYDVAMQRYKGGLSRYLDVLTAEDTLVQQRRAVADLEARAFSLDVALVRALGGGFTSNG
jgi:NodT family efflux transporter outer membrane factor (OMF) lipoprotein